jgi:hypothetical protein
MPKPLDKDRDVYGNWVIRVANASRQALKYDHLMNNGEVEIIEEVYAKLLELDPYAKDVARCNVTINYLP